LLARHHRITSRRISVVLQHKFGAKNAGIFDVDCACASFPALIAVASGLIATTAMRTILVVGVDMIHKLTDPSDPGCFLWSDGAGAAVVEGSNNPGFIGAAFQADGAYASGWGILAGGTFEPASFEAVKAGRTQMRHAAGNYPASVNEENWPRLFERLCSENDFRPDDVDQLLFTQQRTRPRCNGRRYLEGLVRTIYPTDGYKEINHLYATLFRFLGQVPEEFKRGEDAEYLGSVARRCVHHLVNLVYRPTSPEGASKADEFSRRARRDGGASGPPAAMRASSSSISQGMAVETGGAPLTETATRQHSHPASDEANSSRSLPRRNLSGFAWQDAKFGRYRRIADMAQTCCWLAPVANDPQRKYSQAHFLHFRPLILGGR
jgi:hypothetical protein